MLNKEQRAAIVQPISDAVQSAICMAKYRWDDEKEYESWDSFHTFMANKVKEVNPKLAVVRSHKSPFGITVIHPLIPYEIKLLWNGWKAGKTRPVNPALLS